MALCAANLRAFGPDGIYPALILRKGFRRTIDSYSAFFENDRKSATGLRGYLEERGLRRVFVVGLALDFCVRFTVEDAVDAGFETVLIRDACRSVDVGGSDEAAAQAFQKIGIETLSSRQVGA